MPELQWARILVKLDEVCLVQPRLWWGQCVFFILLWWEFPPWFVKVVPSHGNHVNCVTVAREESEGSSHATCGGRSKERSVQVEA